MSEPFWKTSLSAVEPNKILIRGYRVQDLMANCTFGDIIYLTFKGELPAGNEGCRLTAPVFGVTRAAQGARHRPTGGPSLASPGGAVSSTKEMIICMHLYILYWRYDGNGRKNRTHDLQHPDRDQEARPGPARR